MSGIGHGNSGSESSGGGGGVGTVTSVCSVQPVAGNVTLTAANVGADISGAAATVAGNLSTHAGLVGTAAHGLGDLSTHNLADLSLPIVDTSVQTITALTASETHVPSTKALFAWLAGTGASTLAIAAGLITAATIALSQLVPTSGSKIIGHNSAILSAWAEYDCSATGFSLIANANATAMRTTLGLGGAATLDVGTTVGTVCAGDDARILAAEPICNSVQDFRLTLQSGVAIPTTDSLAATTLYLTPYKGNSIALYSGTAWNVRTSAEMSISLANYVANTNYDLFVYSNSGAPTLESCAWTNNTTRATALALQDGVLSKSGATTRRYVGTIRTTSVTGQCEDSGYSSYYSYATTANGSKVVSGLGSTAGLSVGMVVAGTNIAANSVIASIDSSTQVTLNNNATAATTNLIAFALPGSSKCFVWNANNRVRIGVRQTDITTSWTYPTLAWRQTRASAANQIEFVAGANAAVDAALSGDSQSASANGIGLGLDSTTMPFASANIAALSTQQASTITSGTRMVTAGYHYIAGLECVNGSTTYYGFQPSVWGAQMYNLRLSMER